jgi:hypothetical protein
VTTTITLDALGPAGLKLRNMLRPEDAAALLREACERLGSDLSSPQQRYRFGTLLVEKDVPVLRVVGRSIMAQAVLHGANPSRP